MKNNVCLAYRSRDILNSGKNLQKGHMGRTCRYPVGEWKRLCAGLLQQKYGKNRNIPAEGRKENNTG